MALLKGSAVVDALKAATAAHAAVVSGAETAARLHYGPEVAPNGGGAAAARPQSAGAYAAAVAAANPAPGS
jgi:hypothetical protein